MLHGFAEIARRPAEKFKMPHGSGELSGELRNDRDFLSGVLHGFILFGGELAACPVVFGNEHNAKGTTLEHARKAADAIADGENVFRLVPGKWDGCVRSFLVVVIIIFVLV